MSLLYHRMFQQSNYCIYQRIIQEGVSDDVSPLQPAVYPWLGNALTFRSLYQRQLDVLSQHLRAPYNIYSSVAAPRQTSRSQ